MAKFDPNRRQVLKHMAVLGAAGLLPAILPISSARAGDLTAGFVYIGPRLDWGWNQSFAMAAGALRGVPHLRVVEADYLPESTDYGSGKDDAGNQSLHRGDGGLDRRAGLAWSFPPRSTTIPSCWRWRRNTRLSCSAKPPRSQTPTTRRNVGSQYALLNQGHYVNGVAAGLCTTTNKLGFVAGQPFGTVLLNVNSFLLGSRQTNPDATVRVVFTGAWEDAVHDAEATNALVDAGCDVITCHLDAPRVVIETAEGRGVKTCGHAFDQAPLAPKGYITGAEYKWTEMFETFVETLQRGGTLPNFVTGGYDKDYVRSSPFGAGATPEAIDAAKTAIAAMKNGDALFVGPIKDNTGKPVVPAGTVYGPYAEELQQTNYLIEGVIGSIA